MKKIFTLNRVILGVYGVASFLTIVAIHQLNMLSFKFEFLIDAVLIVAFCLMTALMLRVRNKIGKNLIRVLNVVLSIVLFVGSIYVYKGKNALNAISGASQKTYTMSVIVMDDSAYETINDLNEKSIALNMQNNVDEYNQTMDKIKTLIPNVHFDIQDTYQQMVESLYDQSIDALLVNEAYRSMLEVENRNFSDDTRVIWTFEITEDMMDVRKSVNVVNTPFIVYVSGIDTYGSISTVSRSDVNMLVTVNPNTKQILLTSIPRDAWVKLTNMDAYDKLTHSGIEGIENTVSTVENFMNIEVNYYARVNFSSLVAMVDAVGGIDVYSDREFKPWHGDEMIQVGMNHLDGLNALGFARERHAYDDMYEDSERGDQRRVENQQAVMEALIKKLISPAIIKNYSDVLDAVEGMFETNMTSDEITDLIAMQLDDMSDWDFVNRKITGEYEYKYGGAYMPDWELIYYVTDPASVQECVDTINDVLSNKKVK